MSHKENDKYYEMLKEAKEECMREEIGTGRYGCRCTECIEGAVAQTEYREDR